jgi:hypothetical protein
MFIADYSVVLIPEEEAIQKIPQLWRGSIFRQRIYRGSAVGQRRRKNQLTAT